MRTVSFVILATLLIPFCKAFAQGEEVLFKVGFIGSFSGPAQIYGDACRNGFEMALKELNDKRIKVIYEDDSFIPSRTISAFRKLVDQDKVDLVITIGSTPSNAVASLAQTKKIPLLAWASDKQVSQGKSFVMRSYPSGQAEGLSAAEEAKKRGYNKVSLLVSSNDYAVSWQRGVVKGFSEEQLVVNEELSGDISDFRPLILKTLGRKTDAFALCLNPGKTGLFARQVREFQADTKIFGCEYLDDRDELEVSKGALLGAWFATVTVTDDFRKRYQKAYENDSIISGAANHYEIAKIIHEIVESGNNKTPMKILLDDKPREGANGTLRVRSEQDDRYFDIPLVIQEVRE